MNPINGSIPRAHFAGVQHTKISQKLRFGAEALTALGDVYSASRVQQARDAARARDGLVELSTAIHNNDEQGVKALLEDPVIDINGIYPDKDRLAYGFQPHMTPLIHAVTEASYHGYSPDIVSLLLKDPRIIVDRRCGYSGSTALMSAAIEKSPIYVGILLQAGADASIVDFSGCGLLNFARRGIKAIYSIPLISDIFNSLKIIILLQKWAAAHPGQPIGRSELFDRPSNSDSGEINNTYLRGIGWQLFCSPKRDDNDFFKKIKLKQRLICYKNTQPAEQALLSAVDDLLSLRQQASKKFPKFKTSLAELGFPYLTTRKVLAALYWHKAYQQLNTPVSFIPVKCQKPLSQKALLETAKQFLIIDQNKGQFFPEFTMTSLKPINGSMELQESADALNQTYQNYCNACVDYIQRELAVQTLPLTDQATEREKLIAIEQKVEALSVTLLALQVEHDRNVENYEESIRIQQANQADQEAILAEEIPDNILSPEQQGALTVLDRPTYALNESDARAELKAGRK